MDLYDLLMLLVLGANLALGVWKGMAWQVASIASLVLSYFMALRYSATLAPMLGVEAPLNRFVAMFALYLASSLFVWLCFRAVSGFIDRLRLKEFDHQVGAFFGAAKGVLWCVGITFFALSLLPGTRDQVLQSHSGHYIALLLNHADRVMPTEIHQVLDPYLNQLQTELAPAGAKPRHPAASATPTDDAAKPQPK
ncbi:MAG TPA: CvpA family protein [Pirellulales bacterium]|jgi:membrane protein required for colicin V production|nr:CvpA family protein [Pirellulales bacterium]